MVAVVLGETAHQADQLLVLLTVELQLLCVPAAARNLSRNLLSQLGLRRARCRAALPQTLTVALHYVGHNAVGSVALSWVDLPTLGAGAHASLAGAPGSCPVALDAALAEGVITGQRHRLLEQIQADGAGEVSADPVCVRRAGGHFPR